MGRFQIPNLAKIHSSDPDMGRALKAITDAINNSADQANVDPMSNEVPTPAPISQINVTESGGIHDVQVVDQSPAYRGIKYAADYSQTPDFQNFHTIDMGTSQNHRANLGPGKYYWRANNKYTSSDASAHVYHGGTTPAAVGSGSYSGPPMQQQQGFSTQFRKSSTPPVRK